MSATFKRNLLTGYSLSLFLLLLSAIASYFSIRGLLRSAEEVSHTNQVIIKLEGVISLLKDAETGQRGFLITGNDAFLQPYDDAIGKLDPSIRELRELTRDSEAQQQDVSQLTMVVRQRLDSLQARLEEKYRNEPLYLDGFMIGRETMQKARMIVERMTQREQAQLELRTATQRQFAASTPLLIVIASLLAIGVTIVSFFRVLSDFNRRLAMQQELQQKDIEITQRLNIIQDVAEKVAAGNYTIRVTDENSDLLGSLAGSLNKMAGSLDESFNQLAQKEWQQTGMAGLNDEVVGEKDLPVLTEHIIGYLARYTQSQSGAFYLLENGKLRISSAFALAVNHRNHLLQLGEGLAGQSAASGKIMELEGVAPERYTVSFASGAITPAHVLALPIFFEKKVLGVIELASLEPFTAEDRVFLKSAAHNIGIALNTAYSRLRVQELLQETQAQSEELQAQHSELENINTELEAQAEKLQASEEELKVQQEELQQANQELEERSRLLEERNQLILERNLEIKASAEQLEQSTRYKSEFLANMSHELRTPLNSILLLSRLLSENNEQNLSNDQVEYARVIQSSGNGLLTLIDEILDLSKIEAGKMELEYQMVPLPEIVDDLQRMFKPMAAEKGLEFSVHVAEGMHHIIETDRLRVEQILRNLIGNALKFTAKGSVQVQVSQPDDKHVSFAVKDTGIGIAAQKQQTIFEAFQQADGSTRRKYGGTGLGLSISRELARLLGGEITLESVEGKGSTFSLLLPLSKADAEAQPAQPSVVALEADPEADQQPAESAPKAPEPQPAITARFTGTIPAPIPDDRDKIEAGDKVLLIVEDDTHFAQALLDYSRKNGYKGIVSVRGDEGIELAERYHPLGILLDLQLPVKSGWEVMDALKNNPATRAIPVHIMSSQEARTKSIAQGAVDFINKPVAFEKLSGVFRKIEEALSRNPKKVLIVEENQKHAEALSFFLKSFEVHTEIRNSVSEGISALNREEVDCVILDMGVPENRSYEILEQVKKTPGLENLPIIIFTGKSLSYNEEVRIKQFADSIVVKTAHSYKRILDEVSLFLHLVEENKKDGTSGRNNRMSIFGEVLRGKTVLIADDDVRNIFSLTKALEQQGVQVVSAIDGRDALKQLETTGKIDLVLMDMMMPEMDGYEAIREIRKQGRYRNLPIIAVTAKAMTGDREKCIEAGASDYITKPVDIDQLLSLLRVWLYQ
ncbi:response regulator [Pseudocnuella soli]|uniref:response regulator n=1 Tax=Pseudocnuella soli TaxID=2502779 RepID=UPI001045717D|nr:response regulator [Pseudocnuella soli]